jgi:hypothetical protein
MGRPQTIVGWPLPICGVVCACHVIDFLKFETNLITATSQIIYIEIRYCCFRSPVTTVLKNLGLKSKAGVETGVDKVFNQRLPLNHITTVLAPFLVFGYIGCHVLQISFL